MVRTASKKPVLTVMRGVDELTGYKNNSRTHTRKQIEQVAASIKEFGWTNPLIIHKGTVVAGHARLEAAKLLGMTEVPCIDRSDMTATQMQAYVIADNQLALQAGWDKNLLGVELTELKASLFDLDLLGFESRELALLLGPEDGLTDPDEVPEDVPAVTQPGDLWILGEHRLLCGDATKVEDVERVLGGAKPFIMVTDPPYGVEYDAGWRDDLSVADRRKGKVNNDDRADWSEAWRLASVEVFYCWAATRTLLDSGIAVRDAGFEIRGSVVWRKQNSPISRGPYRHQYEPCWYAVRKGATAKWSGDNSQSTVWDIALDKNAEGGHSTQKPVECMERPIRNHGDKTDAVYDPFLGSGTTLIAAQRQGRRGYFIEIDPHYVDVAVARWENFTGKKAVKQ